MLVSSSSNRFNTIKQIYPAINRQDDVLNPTDTEQVPRFTFRQMRHNTI
jgi:hypothetical protein